jgi:hypothetical protein
MLPNGSSWPSAASWTKVRFYPDGFIDTTVFGGLKAYCLRGDRLVGELDLKPRVDAGTISDETLQSRKATGEKRETVLSTASSQGDSAPFFRCPWKSHPGERPPNQYDPKCKARFTDLVTVSSPPPDLPPLMRKLTVIEGGKR